MVLPFYETREGIDFVTSNGGKKANLTLQSTLEKDITLGMNNVFNDTETREMMFAVNGRDNSGSMTITGHRCLYDCVDQVEEVEEQEDLVGLFYWSDPATWLNLDNRIPEEGDEVHIEDGWDVIYDIGESPIFTSV